MKVELSGVGCKNKCYAFMSHKGKRGIGARDNSREGGRRDGYSRQERKKEEVGVRNGWEGREIGEIM